jgi:hypothetical protein
MAPAKPRAGRPPWGAVLTALLGLAGTGLHAQESALNRCAGPGGEAIFTDRPCETMDARPANATRPKPDDVPATTPVVRECPRSPEALREAVVEAMTASDGNRLAELYDWRGRSRHSAQAVMPRLETLAAARLLAAETRHSAAGSSDRALAEEAAQVPPDRLRLDVASDSVPGGETVEFRLVRAAGCWAISD